MEVFLETRVNFGGRDVVIGNYEGITQQKILWEKITVSLEQNSEIYVMENYISNLNLAKLLNN